MHGVIKQGGGEAGVNGHEAEVEERRGGGGMLVTTKGGGRGTHQEQMITHTKLSIFVDGLLLADLEALGLGGSEIVFVFRHGGGGDSGGGDGVVDLVVLVALVGYLDSGWENVSRSKLLGKMLASQMAIFFISPRTNSRSGIEEISSRVTHRD